MIKRLFYIFIFLLGLTSYGQDEKIKISTADVANFWIVYDSVNKLTDRTEQIRLIQDLYLDKASDGLKIFAKLVNQTADKQLITMLNYPKFWHSVRKRTLKIDSYKLSIKQLMVRFKKLYPEFQQPDVCFVVGILNSGGTTTRKSILVGSEIACSNAKTDASELGAWLQNVFKEQSDIISLIAHELGHTQQESGDSENDGNSNLLGYCIAEGSCDFIAELLLQKALHAPYMNYGKTHEKELWFLFEKEMLGQEIKNWLYNGNEAPNGNADLGYFIGYEICKSYYKNSKNKKVAIQKILKLKYTKENVVKFLEESKYVSKISSN